MTSEKKIIAVGSDHAALPAKKKLMTILEQRGFEVVDKGTYTEDSCDYPEFSHAVAEAVESGAASCGLLMCGTGLGMMYAANRHPNIRAALCWSKETAALSREHNDSNILVLPGRVPSLDPLEDILAAWLDTPFSNDERHIRRIRKIER